jgi:hypothetical protein
MTAQAPDTFNWKGEIWQLADGGGLWDPATVGLTPRMLSTANWRGYTCEYAIDGDRLVLSTLRIGLSDEDLAQAGGDGPLVNGRAATKRIGIESWYEELGLPLKYDGPLTLGRDLIQELYVHMGFHPAWKYRNVAELRFREGVLESAEDVSERYAKQREAAGAGASGAGAPGSGATGSAAASGGGPLERIRGWLRGLLRG